MAHCIFFISIWVTMGKSLLIILITNLRNSRRGGKNYLLNTIMMLSMSSNTRSFLPGEFQSKKR